MKAGNAASQQKSREYREMSERVSTCKLCQIQFSPSQLPHKLTMKMLIETEKQIRVRWCNGSMRESCWSG